MLQTVSADLKPSDSVVFVCLFVFASKTAVIRFLPEIADMLKYLSHRKVLHLLSC